MKCNRCPLYKWWDNESDKGEACEIFGDGWDSPFQYEDKDGTTVGCYLDRHYIEKADAKRDEYYAGMAQHFIDEEGERRDAKLSLSNWVLDLMTEYDIEEGAEE